MTGSEAIHYAPAMAKAQESPFAIWLALSAALLFALATGCSRNERKGEEPSGASTAPAPPARVILISIDTLRADHLGIYGYARSTSPTLDALAAEGTLFEDVSSTSTWTLPAHASLLTGLFTHHHGMKTSRQGLPAHVQPLASLLSEQGFATLAVVNSVYLSRLRGLDRGFERFIYVEESVARVSPSTWVTDQAMGWLRELGDQPAFLFMHYYDVHSDYRSLPRFERQFTADYSGEADGSTAQLTEFERGQRSFDPEDAAHLRNLYDAGIRQLDAELQRFFAFLRSEGHWQDSVLIVTADHGEELMDHGGMLHGLNQFQESLRVPLLLRGPGIPVLRDTTTPISLVDVAPTILGLFGMPAPEEMDGRDLGPLLRGETGGASAWVGRRLFSESSHGYGNQYRNTAAVREGALKLHYDRMTKRHALYDLSRDPGEQHDVAAQRPSQTKRLLAELERADGLRGEEAPPVELSREEEEKLKSLGYIE